MSNTLKSSKTSLRHKTNKSPLDEFSKHRKYNQAIASYLIKDDLTRDIGIAISNCSHRLNLEFELKTRSQLIHAALTPARFEIASSPDDKEITNPNIVKVHVNKMLQDDAFIEAKDFFRIKKDLNNEKIYHHIGIYAFTNIALTKYVKLARSKLEIERNLEQMRALENNLNIKVGLCDSIPLGVDTEEDLIKVGKEMSSK